MKIEIYTSDRGLPLVFHGHNQNSKNKQILTVENYIKWYEIFIVKPDGKVKKLPRKYIKRFEKENEGHCAFPDHIPNPMFCRWLTDTFKKFEWDYSSLELIIGRWINEDRSIEALKHHFVKTKKGKECLAEKSE